MTTIFFTQSYTSTTKWLKRLSETGALYALWSLASVDYAIDHGRQTLAQAVAWRNAMIESPDWKVVYSNDGSYLFRLNPNVPTPITGTRKATKAR